MFCYKLTTVLVITVSLWGHLAKSQSNGVTRGVVNGPTGISVEAAEEEGQMKDKLRNVVNGPTAFSVAAEEQTKGEGLFEEVEEDLQGSNDEGNPQFEETDVDLDALDNEDGDERKVVNGHTGSSVQHDQLASGNRGVISTDPKENKENKLKLPKGPHMDTTDWSTDSSNWSFMGGDWAMVPLPDRDNHPTLPAPEIPGPALVVVTRDPLKKVYVSREVEGMNNVTLHYRFYLSEGESPHYIPELKVYQVKGGKHSIEVSSESNRGTWDTKSIKLPESGSFEILFEGQLNKLGNEIAIDDITISGTNTGVMAVNDAGKNPKDTAEAEGRDVKDDATTKKPNGVSLSPDGVNEVTEEQGGEEGTVKPEQVGEGTGKPEETGKSTEKSQDTGEGPENTLKPEQGTEKPDEVGEVTKNPEETGLSTNNSDIFMEGNNPLDVVEGTGLPVQGNETYNTVISEFTDNPEHGQETLSISETVEGPPQGNDTFDFTEAPQYTLAQGKEVVTGIDTNITESADNAKVTSLVDGDLDDFTEASGVNQTIALNFTTDTAVTSGENYTQIENSILPTNLTGSLEVENSTLPTNLTETLEVENSTLPTNLTGTLDIENSTLPTNLTGTLDIENSTLPTNLTGHPEIENSTLPTNLTGNPGVENSTLHTNLTGNLAYNGTNNTLDTTFNHGNVTTPSVLGNQTGPVVTIHATNSTEDPANNATGGGDNTTGLHLTTIKTTPDIFNPLLNATTDQANINNATNTPLIMINSTSPSGSNGTSPGNSSGFGNNTIPSSGGVEGGSSAWSVFKVFLTICILGVAVMGFLYWRRQRRREDEIPVFSRSSHADYHNPTFTDDDSNFASRGTGPNYKSFE